MLKMALKFYAMDLWWLGNSALDLATIQVAFKSFALCQTFEKLFKSLPQGAIDWRKSQNSL